MNLLRAAYGMWRRHSGATPPGPCPCPDTTLPTLPFVGLTWPTAPTITSTATANTDQEIRDAISLGGCHVTVNGSHSGSYFVSASDTKITLNPGAYIENIIQMRTIQRLWIEGPGGSVSVIDQDTPIDFPNGGTTPEYALMATDLMVQCITLEGVGSRGSGIGIRGHRCAIVNVNMVQCPTSCVWSGDFEPLIVNDIIVMNSTLRAAGPESTFRLQNVNRTVCYNNYHVIPTDGTSPGKHNYRIHGMSSNNWASNNLWTNTGFMMGDQAGTPTAIDNEWIDDNILYYDNVNGVFILTPGVITNFSIQDNVVYTDDGFSPPSEATWTVANNTVNAWQAPPTIPDACTGV